MCLNKNTTLKEIIESTIFKSFLQIQIDKYKHLSIDMDYKTLSKIVDSEWYNVNDFSKVYADCLDENSIVLPKYMKTIVVQIGNEAFKSTIDVMLSTLETKLLLSKC